jgi:hypothetical protein
MHVAKSGWVFIIVLVAEIDCEGIPHLQCWEAARTFFHASPVSYLGDLGVIYPRAVQYHCKRRLFILEPLSCGGQFGHCAPKAAQLRAK